jgi:hypothetical protein
MGRISRPAAVKASPRFRLLADYWSIRRSPMARTAAVTNSLPFGSACRRTISPLAHSLDTTEQSMKVFFLATVLIVSTGVKSAEADPFRAEASQLKGFELYSWKDKNDKWVYSLVGGTNRIKTEDEVKAERNQIKTVDELKKAFARLGEGQHVYWIHRIKGFEFPVEAKRKEISDAAKAAKVELTISLDDL